LPVGFALTGSGKQGTILWKGVAAMAEPETNNVLFADKGHFEFFTEQTNRLKPDRYLKALIYTPGICPDTRRRFESLYDAKGRCIVPEEINAGWQTSGSMKATRLAFQLFSDAAPSAHLAPGSPDFEECARYSVSDIFCCGYAPYFVEAIKIRYPDYMRGGK